jgi:hypothetical protein
LLPLLRHRFAPGIARGDAEVGEQPIDAELEELLVLRRAREF